MWQTFSVNKNVVIIKELSRNTMAAAIQQQNYRSIKQK